MANESDNKMDHLEGRRMQMRAVVCSKYGPPEVLELKNVDKPSPMDNEVMVRVIATTVVQADIRIRGFQVPPSFWLPARLAIGVTKPKRPILGTEFAGVIESVGKDVRKFKVGDRVFGLTGHNGGCYAEYRCVPEDGPITQKPSRLSFEEAAAMPMGGLTALYFLRKGKVSCGQKVLIYGASGSIGTYAVQLAKHLGAEVTGVCSTANQDLVRSLGADMVLDYTKNDFSMGKGVYDVVFDTVGKSALSDCMRSLKKGGCFLQAVASPGTNLRMRWAGITAGNKMIGGTMAGTCDDLDLLGELAEVGKIKPVLDRCYGMEQIVEAHRYVDRGHKKGNVTILVDRGQTLSPEDAVLRPLDASHPTRIASTEG